jgi:molecular chaperone GrpE
MDQEKRKSRAEAESQAESGEHPAAATAPKVDGSAAPVQSQTEASAEETLETLRQQMDAARAENEEQLRGWQRTQADFVNFRRRVEQERAELVKSAESGLIRDLLPVVDDIDRAVSSLPPEMLRLTWVEGILLIQRKLEAVLELYGLKPIDALGKEFDPHEHDAVLRDGEPEEATVVTAELQKGYRLHDWVLRPTLVKVGPPANSTAG